MPYKFVYIQLYLFIFIYIFRKKHLKKYDFLGIWKIKKLLRGVVFGTFANFTVSNRLFLASWIECDNW